MPTTGRLPGGAAILAKVRARRIIRPVSSLPRVSCRCGRMAKYLDEPRWFDQVEVGDTWRSQSRTVTETDVVNFASLTGDFNPLHVDHKYCRTTPFGRPIAHGL